MLFLLYRREGRAHESWLPAASANAAETDHLLWALLAISLAVLALVFGLLFRYIVKYRAGSPLDRGAVAQKTWRIETAWTAGTLLVFFGLFVWGADLYVQALRAAARCAQDLRDRQAMDVEGRACGRPARDQCPARAHGPPHRARDDLGGCDSRFLRPRVSLKARRAAGSVRDLVVYRDAARARIRSTARSFAASTTPR